MTTKKLIAGNWKMHGTLVSVRQLAEAVIDGVEKDSSLLDRCDFLVCPTFIHIPAVRAVIDHNRGALRVGGQDCSTHDTGAFTGDIAAPMLKDVGCSAVILGHSERRQHHGESDQIVAAKAGQAHQAGLMTIICVGETEGQRTAGQEKYIVKQQLDGSIPAGAMAANMVIAYEPVWAIGTGKTATPADVAAMHAFIRQILVEKMADGAGVRILYGGSVKPENAAELLAIPDVDGALIGGASLKADQYLAIAKAVQ
ncbi:triose-phosphate isomerase [Micavibrio aeruginosavorus]|uniref:Triosephosphate isomerase n=1 Tax=Micavibrio aeruginosavorus EPB TaxID=349215 RepID=M4VHV5_9BACT|nr:triose-phosphate isomerase [Micavibrio aeruginosavorus]AGH98060.1 Triosephosphate isomerase [Micavibrio aeruginosavorus EPB]